MSHFINDEEAHQIFRQELKDVAERYIKHFGGRGTPPEQYDFIHKGHFRRIRRTLEEVLNETVKRFQAQRKKSDIWPFRIESLNANKKFEILYKELRQYAFSRTDKEANEEIALYGGKPYSRHKHDDLNMHGNVVVEPDYERIEFNTEIGRRTAQNIIRKMVNAGVLVPLKRKGNQPRWYIYGDWQKTDVSYKINTRLNRGALQEEMTRGLIDQGLIKPKK